jgi:cyclopropane-fatty-acyl-phospholipid synthase
MQEQNFAGYRRRSDWIQKYIFPGAELASIAEILRSLGRCTKLSLQSAQDIGQHYAETLKNWRETFLGRVEQVKVLGFDEKFIRMWEYYLAYCEGAFREGYVGEIQLVLNKDQARTQFPVAAVESEQRIELLPASRAGGRQALRITRDKPVFRT